MTRTLFIVSSKSGSTSEPNVLKDYSSRGSSRRSARTRPAANRRVADPGYGAGQDREADRFRGVFLGQPNIGGPYSVLSPFGLVPAAASGSMSRGCSKPRKPWCGRAGTTCRRPTIPPCNSASPVVKSATRSRFSPRPSSSISAPGPSSVESTGKNGKGLIPIDAEPLGAPDLYGERPFFIEYERQAKRTRRTTVRSMPCSVPDAPSRGSSSNRRNISARSSSVSNSPSRSPAPSLARVFAKGACYETGVPLGESSVCRTNPIL
jgi:transaldolase/glucose-6-phosphate isomerase